jgi:hypothetical protein
LQCNSCACTLQAAVDEDLRERQMEVQPGRHATSKASNTQAAPIFFRIVRFEAPAGECMVASIVFLLLNPKKVECFPCNTCCVHQIGNTMPVMCIDAVLATQTHAPAIDISPCTPPSQYRSPCLFLLIPLALVPPMRSFLPAPTISPCIFSCLPP